MIIRKWYNKTGRWFMLRKIYRFGNKFVGIAFGAFGHWMEIERDWNSDDWKDRERILGILLDGPQLRFHRWLGPKDKA